VRTSDLAYYLQRTAGNAAVTALLLQRQNDAEELSTDDNPPCAHYPESGPPYVDYAGVAWGQLMYCRSCAIRRVIPECRAAGETAYGSCMDEFARQKADPTPDDKVSAMITCGQRQNFAEALCRAGKPHGECRCTNKIV
jgi:hypothetical protein